MYVCVVEYLSFFPSFRIDSRITLLLLLLLLLLYSTITHTWCRFVLFHATLRLECCSLVEKNALLSSALVQSNPIQSSVSFNGLRLGPLFTHAFVRCTTVLLVVLLQHDCVRIRSGRPTFLFTALVGGADSMAAARLSIRVAALTCGLS